MKNTQIRLITLAVTSVMLIGICGCEESAKVEQTIPSVVKEPPKLVLYPSPPDKPRIQFLTSISGSADLERKEDKTEKAEVSSFEKFLLGEEEEETEREDAISKPYGIDIYDGKIYVCDVEKKLVEEIDLVKGTFGYMTKERRMSNPVNIKIDRGWKYVADPIAGAVFVYGKDNTLKAILGRDLEMKPVDVEVRGRNCYITDMASGQIIVLDRITGEEVDRYGAKGSNIGQFALITDLAMDEQGNLYATDKILARVTKFDKDGMFQHSFGEISDSIHAFIRPKGIDVDKEGRLWVIDAAPEMAKVYNSEGKLMLMFGGPGNQPGNMLMPASIAIDYDNVHLFKKYFAEGAQIEFLVLVTNQYLKKINIYGFGEFPIQEAELARELEATEQRYIEEAESLQKEGE